MSQCFIGICTHESLCIHRSWTWSSAEQLTMKKEIAAVVFFLKRLIMKAEKLDAEKVDLFVERLTGALQEKYKGHWYSDNPSKGQAFRYSTPISSTVHWHPNDKDFMFLEFTDTQNRCHVKMSYKCILCRCIRVNRFNKEDAELLRACAESGVQYKDLGLPKELTLWVDPGEVCCR